MSFDTMFCVFPRYIDQSNLLQPYTIYVTNKILKLMQKQHLLMILFGT